jgi:CHAT domain-containing protein/tetratricopeptide (TPR) repeat protein
MAVRWVRCALVLIALVASMGSTGVQAQGVDDLTDLRGQVSQLHSQGKYAEAIPIAQRYVALARQKHGEEHTEYATAIAWLGFVYKAQGRYAEAEPLYKRCLAIREKTLGPDHPEVGSALNNLAALYRAQGRALEAVSLYERALAIAEKAFGPHHPEVGVLLNNLAELFFAHGLLSEAEPLYKRDLAITEKALGPNHPDVATSLDNLAGVFRAQGRYADAELLLNRSFAIREKVLGPDHPAVALVLNNLAGLYRTQSRYAEAGPLFMRSLTMREKALGADHPDVGQSLSNLAELYFLQSDWRRASDFWRRSTGIIVRRVSGGSNKLGDSLTGKQQGEAERLRYRFFGLVKAMYRVTSARRAPDAGVIDEMFQAAQWAVASEAAISLTQMAARQAKGGGALARLVRDRQDLVGEWQAADKLLITAKAQPTDKRNTTNEAALSARMFAIDARLGEIDRTLTKDFPEYATLASPLPLSIADVQATIAGNEALLLFLDTPELQPTPDESFIWIVTRTDVRWVRGELGTKTLTERVAALRCGLDATLWEEDTDQRCERLLGARPITEVVGLAPTKVLPFDLSRAYELYRALLGPVEDLIKGKRLLIVQSGPLTSLPFNVLVTESPKMAIPGKLADYREIAWLGTRTAFTVLPSVASLKALRQFAKVSQASRPYLGIGNPLLDGVQVDPRWGEHYKKQAQLAREKQQCPESVTQRLAIARPLAGFAKLFRGAQADIEEVRRWAPLPETADELCAVGRRLGVPEREILLGARATETTLKDLSEQGRLADYAILHFATHGALTGQVQGSAEPGLILTPPAKGTSDPKALERDDGFLTASEIGTLKLDADWVILSACNTAGAQSENAEALSGMARAFFYAGARALLVSHWEVGSDAAVKLTTRAFAELKAHPKIGRAEALRLSMKELIEKGSLAESHPTMWAPFVVVGEAR